MPCIPVGRVLRRSAQAGRWAGLVRTCGLGRLPDRPAPSHRGCHGGADRVRVARRHRRVEDWHGAVARDAAGGSGRSAGGVMPQEFPGIPSQGLDQVEPVMYLSWTGDVPVVDPPCTCAGNDQITRPQGPLCGRCQRGARQQCRIAYESWVSLLSKDKTSQPGSPRPLPCTGTRPDRAGYPVTIRDRKRIVCGTTADDPPPPREAREAAQADAQVPAQRLSRSLPPSTGR